MDCFSQQSEVFTSVAKAHACTLSELIMKLVCPGFAGKANKLNTQGIYMCTHVYIRVHTYKYLYVRSHIDIVYTWLLLGKCFLLQVLSVCFQNSSAGGCLVSRASPLYSMQNQLCFFSILSVTPPRRAGCFQHPASQVSVGLRSEAFDRWGAAKLFLCSVTVAIFC